MTSEDQLARDLRDSLRPMWRKLTSEGTLSPGKYGALGRLDVRGRATASELATAENVSPQAMATAVRELEKDGLVVRTPDEQDRRRVWLSLTPAGRERLTAERALGNLWLEQMLGQRLSASERAKLNSVVPLLRRLGSEVAGE